MVKSNIAKHRIEQEAAAKVAVRLATDLGLTPQDTWAELQDGALTVKLADSFMPIAQVLSNNADGRLAFAGVLVSAFQLRQHALDELISRITARSVMSSSLQIDFDTRDVTVVFRLRDHA